MPDDLGTVFISYSHDTPAHAKAVLALSNKLRSEGIDCVLDQYESSPAEGWPQWMDREINRAQFVLMVCTERYCLRTTGEEVPSVGHGVAWESSSIYNHIYNASSLNTKFIPVIFDPADTRYIPTPVQGATRYCISTDEGYEQLYSRLIGKPPAEKPPLGKRKALSQREVKTVFSSYSIRVTDDKGSPIRDCTVVAMADNATTLRATTGVDGTAPLSVQARRSYRLLVAHPEFPAAIIERLDPAGVNEIVLPRTDNVGSMVIDSAGYIPGLAGRLCPILDSINRTYLYADNIAINGQAAAGHPATFRVNEPFELEDANGMVTSVTIKLIVGPTSLLKYLHPRRAPPPAT